MDDLARTLINKQIHYLRRMLDSTQTSMNNILETYENPHVQVVKTKEILPNGRVSYTLTLEHDAEFGDFSQ